MMSWSHAVSGAAGWLGLCAIATSTTALDPTPLHVGAGAVIAAGAAIFNDIDHTGSRVARSLGWITWIVARIFTFIADLIRDATCDHCDTPGTTGHRTLSHTLAFAIAAGLGVSAAGHFGGLVGAAIIVGVGAALGVLGLVESRIGAVIVGVAAGSAVYRFGGGVDWWWLGLPVGWGLLAHTIGDGLTSQAVPFWWPAKIRGCTWRRVGLPRWLRFPTGGFREVLLSLLMLAGGGFAGWVLMTG